MTDRASKSDLLELAEGWRRKGQVGACAAFADAFQEVYPRLWEMLQKCDGPAERLEFLLSYRDLLRRQGSLLLDQWESSLPGCIVI